MKHGLLLIAFLIAATALTSGEYSSVHQAIIQTTQTPLANTTTVFANTTTVFANTTTPGPKTTTANATTTTANPTTTTANATTTTANATTTPANATTPHTNITTLAPNTTTSSAPNTTTAIPSPTPPTTEKVGKYNLSQDGVVCIMADFAVTIRVNNSKVNGTFIVQPDLTTVDGECVGQTSINVRFKEGGISLKFQQNNTAQKVYVEYLSVDLTYAFKTGESVDISETNRSLTLFAADLGHSYSCNRETVYMGNGTSLDFTKNRVQALNFKNNQFGPMDLCKADQPDYRVPIAVGIILIILIIIVVIAYLISRRRRTDGYQSL